MANFRQELRTRQGLSHLDCAHEILSAITLDYEPLRLVTMAWELAVEEVVRDRLKSAALEYGWNHRLVHD